MITDPCDTAKVMFLADLYALTLDKHALDLAPSTAAAILGCRVHRQLPRARRAEIGKAAA